MNDHDKQNLEFLSTIAQNEHSWSAWCSRASLDDIEYAIELLSDYKFSLQCEMLILDELENPDNITDLSDAETVLRRF